MLTFQHPHALWLLAGTAVVLLMHLRRRRPGAFMHFPAARLLPDMPASASGWRRWRERLLMAVRMIFVAALALLVASPQYIPSAGTGEKAPGRIAVVLDDSASMASPRAWQEAREALREVLQSARRRVSEVQIFTTCGGNYAGALPDSASAGWERGRPAEALNRAAQWLGTDRETSGQLVVVSDFQCGEWSGALPAFGSRCGIRLVPVTPARKNSAVTRVETEYDRPGRLHLAVTVHNYSAVDDCRQLRVQFGGRQVEPRQVALSPGETVRELFTVEDIAAQSGEAVLLPPDDLPRDDRRLFSCAVPPVPEIWLLRQRGEGRAEDGYSEAAYFADAALTARGEKEKAPCLLRTVDTPFMHEIPDEVQAAVLLNGLSGELAGVLRQYVERGGRLLYFPARVSLEEWHCLQRAGVLESRADKIGMKRQNVMPFAAEQPLGRLFADGNDGGLYDFAVHRYVSVKPCAEEEALLRLTDGSPALIYGKVGRGGVYALTFGLAAGDSAFALTAAFLPLLRELALSGQADRYAVSAECGEALPSGQPAGRQPAVMSFGAFAVAVNVPSAESTLGCRPLNEIGYMLSRPTSGQPETVAGAVPGETAAGEKVRQVLLVCIWCCLAFALSPAIWRSARYALLPGRQK